jgi:hypothetical protein
MGSQAGFFCLTSIRARSTGLQRFGGVLSRIELCFGVGSGANLR